MIDVAVVADAPRLLLFPLCCDFTTAVSDAALAGAVGVATAVAQSFVY